MESKYQQEKYKPEIDGLRAFAVVAVILNHTSNNLLPNGFLGVDIFFVISGFVLTLSMEGKKNKNFFEFFISFFHRRIKRLFPALIIFCVISGLLITLFNPYPQISHITGITGLLGLSNLYLLQQSTNYFANDAILNPFTHTWSLDVEEQFYLLFPFFIWFSGFGRQTYSGKKKLLNSMLFFSVLSFAIYIFLNINYPISSYFLMPSRFWEMGIGCILYLLLKKNNTFIQTISSLPPSVFLALITVIMLSPKSSVSFTTSCVVFLTALLIISLKEDTKIYKLFNNNIVNHIGLLSYSLYLWHWAVLSLSAWTIGIHFWSIPFQYVLMYLLALLSYKYVEQPFRNNDFLNEKWKLFICSFLTLFGSATFIASLSLYFKDYLFLGDKNLNDNYSEKELWSFESCSTSSRGKKIPEYKLINDCWFKEPKKISEINNLKQIFFYGSSYNQHLMSIPAELSKYREDLKFNSYSATGCIATKFLNYSSGSNDYCKKVFDKYFDFFMKFSNEGDQLVLANSYNIFINNETLLDNYIQEIEDLSIYLKSKKLKLILVSPIPVIKSNPTICSNWYAKYNNKCDIKEILDKKKNTNLKKINQKLMSLEGENINFVNIYSLLENKLEYSDIKNYTLFYNKSHLSKKGAKLFKNDFEKIFSE